MDRLAAEVLPSDRGSQRSVFRGKFVDGLKTAFSQALASFTEPAALQNPNLRVLASSAVPPITGRLLETALRRTAARARYLGPYTHRVAISNHRLVALADGIVTFRWRDSAHNTNSADDPAGQRIPAPIPASRVPPGFVRIRHFGFLANRQRATLLPLCFRLLQSSAENLQPTASPAADRPHPSTLWHCPVCGGTMHVVERLSAAQLLLLRSPPHPALCAA